jgi:Tol biopolymer transport system component
MTTPARVAAAAVIGVLAIGGASLIFGGAGQTNVGGPSPSAPSPTTSATTSSNPSAASSASALDYSTLKGRLLVEHLGNALDLSEQAASDYNGDRRRLYFMDPSDMTSRTAVEFLPGKPATGKSAADVSSDERKVVFQDWAPQTRLYEANLDGTAFRQIPIKCTCSLLDPDYDPAAARLVYVRVEANQSWLEIRDLATDRVMKVQSTVGGATDAVPEQPAWSPDGKTIAFSRITWGTPNEPWVGTVHNGNRAPRSGVLSLLDVASGTVTDLPISPDLVPGDPNWSPDSTTILFAAGPFSTTGSVAAVMTHANYAIGADGTGLKAIPGIASPEFLPDGQHIVFKNDGSGGALADGFSVMLADYTHVMPVNRKGMDLTDLAQGFSYVGHWLSTP